MNIFIIFIAITSAASMSSQQWDGNNDGYIGQQLLRQKRDLIGWNRAHNTVHQYGRHKTAGDDFMPYVKQYKKFMMKLNPKNRQELRKALKTIRQRRNSQN